MNNKQFLLLSSLIIISSCSMHKNQTSLYEQIGGEPVISKFSLQLAENLIQDTTIGFLFEKANANDFSILLNSQICKELGGNCVYEGLSMPDAHSGMNINTREFDVFTQIFIRTMKDVGINFKQQNKLLKIFAPMRKDIINK